MPKQKTKNKIISEEIAAQLAQNVVETVKHDLSNGQLEIQLDNQQRLSVDKNRESRVKSVEEKRLYEVIKKRKNLQQELERIKHDQDILKQKIVKPMKNSQEGKTRYFRSEITEEQKAKINQIIKETKKFEKEVKKKSFEIQQKQKRYKEEQKLERKRKFEEENEEKRKMIIEKLHSLEKRKIQRQEQLIKANKQFHKVLNEKFLYEKLQQKWRNVEKSQQEQNQRLLQKYRQQKKLESLQIQQHARRYSQLALRNKQKREEALKKSKIDILEKSRLVNYAYSSFFSKVNQQEEEKRKQQIQNMRQTEVLQTKRANYAETVRQKNKSEFKGKKKSPLPKMPQVDIRSAKSLDNLALNKLGNNYMKQIHSNIDEGAKTSHKRLNIRRQNHQFKYPDYLTKARLDRSSKNPQQPIEISEIKKIMISKHEDGKTKLAKAKYMINKMDEKSEWSEDNMLNSILAKLQVIKHFSGSR